MHHVRIESLQKLIRAEGLKALLVLTANNRRYLSGFSGTEGALLVTTGTAKLFVDGRYTARARRESSLPIHDIAKLPTALKSLRGKTVGVEDTIPVRDFNRLKKKYRGVKWKVTTNLIEQLRQVKSKEELANITKGSRLIDQAFRLVRKMIARRHTHGITELEIGRIIESFGREHGATGTSFDPIVAWGKNSALPHHASAAQKIGKNNFLLLDFGFTVDGYQSDFTRTLFIGKPSSRQREIYEIVREAEAAGIDAVTPGEKAGEMDAVVRDYIIGQGYGDYFPHSTGHGVGLEIHELPNLSHASKSTVLPGAVVTIEPGIYIPGKYGVRIEDMVVVGKRPRVLSSIPQDFDSMVVRA